MNFATTVDPEDALKVYKYSDVRAFWDEISPLQALLTHGKADCPWLLICPRSTGHLTPVLNNFEKQELLYSPDLSGTHSLPASDSQVQGL